MNNYIKNLKLLGVFVLAGVLGSLAAAQAQSYTFRIVDAPIALNKNSPKFESIRITGRGMFDPLLGVASASGTYTLFNAFDHPNGPVIHATWHSSGFVSWIEAGSSSALTIKFESSDPLANPNGPGEITLMKSGIQGPIIAGEPYIVPPGGSGGSVKFADNDEPFFPPVP